MDIGRNDDEQIWHSTQPGTPAPEGWQWLNACPWRTVGPTSREHTMVCGLAFVGVGADAFDGLWWVGIDTGGFLVLSHCVDGSDHEAAPLAVIDALRARAGR